jgi:hypothetical protein
VARRAEVVAASGSVHYALHAVRRQLRARSHAGSVDYFRRTFVRDYVTGESIRGKRCLAPCPHIFGNNASEHQFWVHVTSTIAQDKSAHEKLAAAAVSTSSKKYKPRGDYSKDDYDLVTLIIRLGGTKLLFAFSPVPFEAVSLFI